MSNNDNKDAQSPDMIEELIPGKNEGYNDKSLNRNNNNNNNQQPLIEHYDEKEAVQDVLEVTEEYEKNTEKSIDNLKSQIPRYAQASTDMQQQTAQSTKEIAENYLQYQSHVINSFQSVFMPYFENIYNQLSNNQEFFRRIQENYSRMISSYTENAIVFNRIFNEIMFSNINLFTNAVNGAKEQSIRLVEIGKRSTSA